MELSHLSLQDLRSLEQQVRQQLKRREQSEQLRARQQILALAQQAGIALQDLIDVKPRPASPTKGIKIAAKYRHPRNPQATWTGRGRKPVWLEDFLQKGHSLEEFLIPPQD